MDIDIFKTYKGKAYRFISFDGLFKTLKSKSLRYTRIDQLNDPLDCSPFLGLHDWENHNPTNRYMINKLRKSYEKFYRTLYICCFCKRYNTEDSYLMWSHYGSKHSQLCFEIDFSKISFLGDPEEIIYPEDLFKYREEQKIKTTEEQGIYLATTKLKQWKYEEEVRLIIDTNTPNIEKKLKPSNDKYHIYAKFDLSYISKVVFGVDSEINNEYKTIEMFKKRGLNPVFENMYIDPVTLKLKAEKFEKFNDIKKSTKKRWYSCFL